jgi:hypothetical protein
MNRYWLDVLALIVSRVKSLMRNYLLTCVKTVVQLMSAVQSKTALKFSSEVIGWLTTMHALKLLSNVHNAMKATFKELNFKLIIVL